jgi:hypothetical protein
MAGSKLITTNDLKSIPLPILMAFQRRHVFNDLQPYVCILKDCKTPDRVFTSRRAWEDHLRQETGSPLSLNVCPLCLDSFQSPQKWRNHVGREMQQLALFAIPKELYGRDEDDDSIGESGDNNDESDDDSVLSKVVVNPTAADDPSGLKRQEERIRILAEYEREERETKAEHKMAPPHLLPADRKRGSTSTISDEPSKPDENVDKKALEAENPQEEKTRGHGPHMGIPQVRMTAQEHKPIMERVGEKSRLRLKQVREWELLEKEEHWKKEKVLEDEMHKKLSEFGFQENQIEAVLKPNKAAAIDDDEEDQDISERDNID